CCRSATRSSPSSPPSCARRSFYTPRPWSSASSREATPLPAQRRVWRCVSSRQKLGCTCGLAGKIAMFRGPRRGVRVVDGARLEIWCGESHRGFESHPLRYLTSQPEPAAENGALQLGLERPTARAPWRGVRVVEGA